MNSKLIALAVLGILLIGCEPGSELDKKRKTSQNVETIVYNVGGSEFVRVYEFRLEDGTRCVTRYNNKSGISCNWK